MNMNLFREAMLLSGRTCGGCAEQIGVNKNTFSKVMSGQRSLTVKEAEILCDYFNITNNNIKVAIFLESD